jgi:hypothetical protein
MISGYQTDRIRQALGSSGIMAVSSVDFAGLEGCGESFRLAVGDDARQRIF